jgi:hypothetical protein
MDEELQIAVMKRWLVEDVASFSSHDGRFWKQPVADTIKEIREHGWRAVYFGGTLRSLLLGRLEYGQSGRPRDIDIVVGGPTVDEVASQFKAHVVRRTRFGGLHLKRFEWEFDVWPVDETYAFREGIVASPGFEELPRTTFFNLESIAIDVWAERGRPRNVYTADDSFFQGILRREIEINNESNPFPGLCVIRAFVLCASLSWHLGPRLVGYISKFGPNLTDSDVESIQMKHYGRVELSPKDFRNALNSVQKAAEGNPHGSFKPFLPAQMTFWPEEDTVSRRIGLRMLKLKQRAGEPRVKL